MRMIIQKIIYQIFIIIYIIILNPEKLQVSFQINLRLDIKDLIMLKAKKKNLKKVQKYIIVQEKKLIKMIDIKNPISNEIIAKVLTVIPLKDSNKLLAYYHLFTGHKNYHILHDKIISEGYYWNNITD